MRHLRIAAVVVLLAAIAACGGPPDRDAARSEVAAADSAWQAAASAGEDLDEIASYLAEDAVMIPPNEPPLQGRDAIRRYMAAGYATPGFSVSWQTLDVRTGPSGELAYMTHLNRFSAQDSAGRQTTFRGRGVTIWERDASGEWKCVLDIWNQADVGSARRAGREAS